MSPLEIGIIATLGTALAIYITVTLIKHFKKKKGKKNEEEDD